MLLMEADMNHDATRLPCPEMRRGWGGGVEGLSCKGDLPVAMIKLAVECF